MVKRIGSRRRKTRMQVTKAPGQRGKISLSKYFAKFNNGQKVVLKLEPSVAGGLYFHRFHGKIGTIDGMQGKCYFVKITDGHKEKRLIVHPVHMKMVGV